MHASAGPFPRLPSYFRPYYKLSILKPPVSGLPRWPPPDSNEETASYTLRNQLSIAIYTALARLHPLPIRSSQPFRPAPAHLPLLRFAPRTHPNFSYEFPKLPLPCDLVPLFPRSLVPLFPRSSFPCPLVPCLLVPPFPSSPDP